MNFAKALKYPTFLFIMAAAIHALVLANIFPGFYHPTQRFHSDFYLPAALANSNFSISEIIHLPRPVGMVILACIGFFGVKGSISAVIAVIFFNCALSALVFMRVLGARLNRKLFIGFAVYAYLIFSQPYFFTFSTHDALSPFSYAFMMMGFYGWIKCREAREILGLSLLACLSVTSFLIKETYGISLLLLVFWSVVCDERYSRPTRLIKPLAIVLGALSLAFTVNSINNSPFTSGENATPYEIVLSPISVAREWWIYAREGLNILSLSSILIAVVGFLAAGQETGKKAVALVFCIAGVLAWFPNSLLPNHHYSGYAISGSYLLFSPVLLLGVFWGWSNAYKSCAVIIAVCALASPILWGVDYKKNEWVLAQGRIQDRVLAGLQSAAKQRSSNTNKILISGFSFPFDPFVYGQPIGGISKSTSLDVLSYNSVNRGQLGVSQAGAVQRVSINSAHLKNYDELWLFRQDGSLLQIVKYPQILDELALYPDLHQVFQGTLHDFIAQGSDGYKFLQCGTILSEYENWDGAAMCLKRAVYFIGDNPYSHYFLGVAQEKQGDVFGAKKSFEDAIARDDAKNPNSAFREGLRRVDAVLRAKN